MFICNAWELMLKAHMINKLGENSIYYLNNPDRTLSLSDCIKKIFTNDKDPLRINIEKIIELRNTSTHFITEEYEMVYVPLFQACVLNFNDKMLKFHNIDMTLIVPQNFLTLSVSLKALNEAGISANYPEGRNSADAIFHIAKDGEEPVAVIKELKEPELVFKYTAKTSIETIINMLTRNKIQPLYNGQPAAFTKYHFSNLVKYFGIKNNKKFCWKYDVGNTTFYRYSLQALEFIVEEIKKDPKNILNKIK